jgi:hypothetical protein
MTVEYRRRSLLSAFEVKERFAKMEEEVPIQSGGLTEDVIRGYLERGWVRRRTVVSLPDWPVTFGTHEPGRTVVKRGTLPAGTDLLVNEVTHEALVVK